MKIALRESSIRLNSAPLLRRDFRAGFTDVEEKRTGGLIAGLVFDRVTEAVGFGNPFGGGEEDFALVLAFGNEDAVEADIIDDDAVGKVFDGEGDQVFVAVPFDAEPRRNGLAGSDRELW